MSNGDADTGLIDAGAGGYPNPEESIAKSFGTSLFYWVAGLFILFVLWWIGGYLIELNPNTTNFKDFGPIPTFQAFPELFAEGKIQAAVQSSGYLTRMNIFPLMGSKCVWVCLFCRLAASYPSQKPRKLSMFYPMGSGSDYASGPIVLPSRAGSSSGP